MPRHLALVYARRLHWRMLPVWWLEDGGCACPDGDQCRSPGKHAMLRDWPTRATTKASLLERWAERWPKANWACATGEQSGVWALDVDGPEGERSLVELERRFEPLAEYSVMQWTGGNRGGWQIFFEYPAGRTIGSGAGQLGPKLDHRGAGGYVLVAPSVTVQEYYWEINRSPFDLPPAIPPDWLVDLLDPPAQVIQMPRQGWSGYERALTDNRYLLRAVEAELALVACAPNGRRNDTLNDAAFRLFRFAADGRLQADAIAHALEAVAQHAGLQQREIAATLKSAARKRGIALP